MQRLRVIGLAGLLGIFAIVAACGSDEATQQSSEDNSAAAVAGSSSPASPVAADGSARMFAVDAAQSEVYWRIYRAGLMARLGHNHIISVGELEGDVALASNASQSSWNLSFPVQGLTVDDPQIRSRYGEDFESEPSEDDIAGTKRNMLSEDVLNGDVYGSIRLSGMGFNGTMQDARMPTQLQLLGQSIDLTLPASIAVDGDTITISGEFQLSHETLGMSPFTALGGAMSVGEDIDFTYRIVAVAAQQ